MKKIHLLTLLFILIAASCTANKEFPQKFSYLRTPEKAGFTKIRLSRIDSLCSSLVNQGILPNVVTFVARNGKVVHNKAYGWRSIESKLPVQTDDIFRIASQSKAVTSVGLMTLYEEGKFLLDDPISKYIPEFRNVMVLDSFNIKDTTWTGKPAKRPITIRHLLTHTSGIHYGILLPGVGNMMFAKEGIPAAASLEELTIDKVVKKIAKMPLMFEPGEQYLYGMNLDVAGYLIEILSGKKLDVFLKERIFDPLGMNDTYFYLPDEKKDRLVSLYEPNIEGKLKYHTNKSYQDFPIKGAKTLFLGGAGLCGTITDYAKFCQMVLNGGTFNKKRILSRRTVELMTTNQIGTKDIGRFGDKFGLGFEIFSKEHAANRLVSEGALGWGGMYYTDFEIDPKENMVLLIYTNILPYSGPGFRYIFHNMVYQALE